LPRVCCFLATVVQCAALFPFEAATLAETTDYEVMRYAQNHKDRRGCYVGESWVDFRGVSLRRIKTMKLTDEDRAAWFDWQVNRNRNWLLWGALERISPESDHQDAQLMSVAQYYRKTHGKDCSFLFGPVLCGGALERFTGLDELEAFI